MAELGKHPAVSRAALWGETKNINIFGETTSLQISKRHKPAKLSAGCPDIPEPQKNLTALHIIDLPLSQQIWAYFKPPEVISCQLSLAA
jgi:hypothetical protein